MIKSNEDAFFILYRLKNFTEDTLSYTTSKVFKETFLSSQTDKFIPSFKSDNSEFVLTEIPKHLP
jgi:hypothetical protein